MLFLRSKDQVVTLSEYLECDVFIIGGAKTYAEFADVIDKWIVTEVLMAVEDADTFMPRVFLDGFDIAETRELEDDLKVKMFQRI